MSEALRQRPPRLWPIWICAFTPLAFLAQLLACMRPVVAARRLICLYANTIGKLPWVGPEIRQMCEVLDFQLLSEARPAEALALLEAKLAATPEALFVCADYAIAGLLSERLFLREKALSYYQRAGEMAPPTSAKFRVGMAERIQRLGGQSSW
jgi:hypothetical protein